VRAFVINKFRGDVSLLEPGIADLEGRSGLPCLGVIPFSPGLSLDAEDSLGLPAALRAGAATTPADASSVPTDASERAEAIDVALVALPALANFTDIDALALEDSVTIRLVASAAELGDPDLVVLPGSKSTVADLAWLRATGLAGEIVRIARHPSGPSVLGICAGYQMLGRHIVDDVESGAGGVEGLGVLPVRTVFEPEKLTRPRRGRALGETVSGYEIRHGRPAWTGPHPPGGESGSGASEPEPFAVLDDDLGTGPEGVRLEGGRLAGTNLHGLFEADGFRREFLAGVARRRGKVFASGGVSFAAAREAQIDLLADLVEEHLDVAALLELAAASAPPSPDTTAAGVPPR
jgi:adenosylcobyric acid synthase